MQDCQSDIGAGKGPGADCPECHHAAQTGQPRDQAQPAQFRKDRYCSTKLVSLM